MGRFAEKGARLRAMTPDERRDHDKLGQKWREESREAMESSNAWVEKHGLPLAKYRQF
jgi:post-segregation antitoxin (ccd killing protein)